MNNEVEHFLSKYEAHASLSDRKQYAKRIPMSVSDYHRYNTAMDVYQAESYMQREPYVEMYIPQHKFQEMIERDRYYNQLSQQVDYASKLIEDKLRDEAIHKTNPAVKKAYDKYKMLLEIAR